MFIFWGNFMFHNEKYFKVFYLVFKVGFLSLIKRSKKKSIKPNSPNFPQGCCGIVVKKVRRDRIYVVFQEKLKV